jgi:hypothetical protein
MHLTSNDTFRPRLTTACSTNPDTHLTPWPSRSFDTQKVSFHGIPVIGSSNSRFGGKVHLPMALQLRQLTPPFSQPRGRVVLRQVMFR